MYQDDDDSGLGIGEPDGGAIGRIQTEAMVTCPHCAEEFELTLDPDGGGEQEYVEDCEICCRACQVNVVWDEDGVAEVTLEEV